MTYLSADKRLPPRSIGDRLIQARKKFAIVSLVSALILLLLVVIGPFSIFYLSGPPPGPGGSESTLALLTASIAAIGSCATMVTTFLAFVSATLLAWMKDRREGRAVELDNQRKQFELDKERWKLEQERKNPPKTS